MTAAGRGGPHGPERDERVTLPQTQRLGRRGRGPVLVSLLVVAAFLVGVVRPWDWISGAGRRDADAGSPVPSPAGAAPSSPSTGPDAGAPAEPSRASPPAAPYVQPTCAYPASWRLAAVQEWGGRTARVWSATDAVVASGPDDASIPFAPIVSSVVTAFGWCAPVSGPERPPLAAVASLYRIDDAGTAREIPFDRLEPAAPDALGELWMPVPQSVGRRPPWPAGRYVIRLAAPGGTFERYVGIEVVVIPREGVATPQAAATPTPPVPATAAPTTAP